MDDLRERMEKRLAELRKLRDQFEKQLIAADSAVAEVEALLTGEPPRTQAPTPATPGE